MYTKIKSKINKIGQCHCILFYPIRVHASKEVMRMLSAYILNQHLNLPIIKTKTIDFELV